MKIDIELPTQELIVQVTLNRTKRAHEKDNSIIGQWAKSLNITSGKAIRKAEIKHTCNYLGVNMITKIRTGTAMFTNQLVRILKAPASLKNKCICCKENTIEDVEHLILDCKTFSSVRERCIPNLNKNLERHQILKKLLGEEGLTSGRKITRELLGTIEYLSCILPKRAALIAERKGDM